MKFITTINLLFFLILIILSSAISTYLIVPINVDPQKLEENVSIATPEKFTITIKNTGLRAPFPSDQLNLRYKIIGLNETWLEQPNGSSLESLTTELAAGEAKFIQVTINVSNGTIPGKYDGEILLIDNKSPTDKQPYKKIQTSLKINKPSYNGAQDRTKNDNIIAAQGKYIYKNEGKNLRTKWD